MLDRLTAKQLSEWEAFYTLNPPMEVRSDIFFAHMASLITNLAIKVNGKKGAKTTKPKDFLIEWDTDKKAAPQGGQSVQQMREFLLAFAEQQNKAVERKEKEKSKKSGSK